MADAVFFHQKLWDETTALLSQAEAYIREASAERSGAISQSTARMQALSAGARNGGLPALVNGAAETARLRRQAFHLVGADQVEFPDNSADAKAESDAALHTAMQEIGATLSGYSAAANAIMAESWLTNTLVTCMSWLLFRRAAETGEISAADAVAQSAPPQADGTVGKLTAADLQGLPPALFALLTRAYNVAAQIDRLHTADAALLSQGAEATDGAVPMSHGAPAPRRGLHLVRM